MNFLEELMHWIINGTGLAVEQARIIDNYILILDYIKVEFTSFPSQRTVEVKILAHQLNHEEKELVQKIQYIVDCWVYNSYLRIMHKAFIWSMVGWGIYLTIKCVSSFLE
jgi:hypothetical protein